VIRENNIKSAVYRCVAKAVKQKKTTRKTTHEIEIITKRVVGDLKNNSFDFTTAIPQTITKHGDVRYTKKFYDFLSTESVLCQYIRHTLDKTLKVTYPNRNKMVNELFNTIIAILPMSDFTVFRFDFKNYFNTVSAEYVFERYVRDKMSSKYELDLVRNYVTATKFAYAGLGASNVLAEIIAADFDNVVQARLSDRGVLFYARYIDDGIIVFNEHIDEAECKRVVQDALVQVYRNKTVKTPVKCTTRFNNAKFVHISKRNLTSSEVPFSYLGYEFFLRKDGNKAKVKYGITSKKQKKYSRKLDALLLDYKNSLRSAADTELLRHQIAAFTSRTVYQGTKYKKKIWKVKGFIANYGELRFLLDSGLLHSGTGGFLREAVKNSFRRVGLSFPYFMKGTQECAYNFFDNMRSKRTLLLVQNIGYDESSLISLCGKIGISSLDRNGKKRGYGNMVREYLILTKVGY